MMSIQNWHHGTNSQVVISWAQPKDEIQNGYPALSLPGFRSFMDPKKSRFRKKIWFIIFLCCCCLSIAQISERVQYYLKYPVSMTLTIEKNSDDLRFPKICICSQHGFKSASIWKALQAINGTTFTDLVVYGNMTLEELWNISGEELNTFLDKCTYGTKTCSSPKYWETKYTILGRCYILDLGKKVRYYGHSSGIQLKIREAKNIPIHSKMEHMRWKILLHDDSFNINYDILSQGSILYKTAHTTLMYWQKKYHYRDTPIRPCVPAHIIKDCENHCYDMALLNGTQCKLPFMETVPSFPPCSGQQTAKIYAEYPSAAVFVYDKNQCICGTSCFDSTIDVQPDSRQANPNLNVNRSLIDIFPSRPETEIIHEVRAYNLPSLFSDIGGALGLYLGMSVLTFLEIFETVTKIIIRKLRHSYLHRKPV